MDFYSWNVNGIRACWAKGDLGRLLSEKRPDVVCLQEIKATEAQSPLVGVDDYNQFWFSSQTKKGYSGTLILSRQPVLKTLIGFNDSIKKRYNLVDQFGDSNAEGRLLTVELKDCYVVNVYTPNSKGDLSRLKLRQVGWDPAFRDHCLDLARQKPVLAGGDFNVAHNPIDLARPEANVGKHGFTAGERQGFSDLLTAGFVDSFRDQFPDKSDAYSWWTAWGNARSRNVGWRIDYWVVSQSLAGAIGAATIETQFYGSDHCPIGLNLKF